MIVCPHCKLKLDDKYEGYHCNQCDYKADVIDGTIHFLGNVLESYENYNKKGLDKLYEFENKHFWFKNRRNVIVKVFEEYVKKSDELIEIGAGTGSVARSLLKKGYKVSVGEIHASGLKYAKSYGINHRYQVDLFKNPSQEHFDAVGMFDVLEHFEDENSALKNIHMMLRKNGKLILTVPAHKWLWSRDDELASHKRRYTSGCLRHVLEQNGFEVLKIKHFFISILPLLYLRTFLHPAKGNSNIEQELTEYNLDLNFIVNSFLDKITHLENSILQKACPSMGGSILCVAKKIPN